MTTDGFRSAAFAGSLFAAAIVTPTSTTSAQTGGSASVIQRFAGTWREDVTQRKLGGPGLRFQLDSKGALQELRGPEARPVYHDVVFDSKPRPVPDGTNTIAWKQNGPASFERVLNDKDRVITTRRIQLSPDGKTLTERTERKLTDGRTAEDTFVFQRTTGDAQGLVGRWKPQSFKTNLPAVNKYEAAGTSGLKFLTDNGVTWTGALDGKPTPVAGAGTIAGTSRAAKAVDDYTIEFTQFREGVVTGKTVSAVSRDGKTMTVTSTPVGPSPESSVVVYLKQ